MSWLEDDLRCMSYHGWNMMHPARPGSCKASNQLHHMDSQGCNGLLIVTSKLLSAHSSLLAARCSLTAAVVSLGKKPLPPELQKQSSMGCELTLLPEQAVWPSRT